MDKEEIKNRIDLNNVQELVRIDAFKDEIKTDYLVDFEGNYIIPLSPLEVKLIEKIKDLEERIKKIESEK